ncbi:MAG: DUF1844 domain-containing protein [Desulfobacteraceae bacterium]|nr:MAG: DUF1844 domain-containing protein [Desulfobacteraceae bacterium]
MEEEKKDFVIRDRRIFSQEKEETKADKKDAPDSKKEAEGEAQKSRAEADDSVKAAQEAAQTRLPEINFPTFIFSLNASALVQLGLMEDPGTGKKEKNLPLAKQTIDMLSMLQEKTAGNLTKDEEEMLKQILYDLRIRYVKEKK